MKCIFCEIAQGKAAALVVREDEKQIAFMDKKPQIPGHILVIPKAHVETWLDMNSEDLADLMIFCQQLGRIIRENLQPALVFEKMIGKDIPHVHVHLLPWKAKGLSRLSLPEIQQKIIK